MASVAALWRRWRTTALVASALFVVYSVAGFFVAPPLARSRLLRLCHETLGVEASIARVRTNPWTLRATVEAFEAHERGGGELVAFDELSVNLQASSLFRRAWVFKKIHLVAPRVAAVVGHDGRLNLGALAPDTAAPAEPAEEEGGIPRVIVREFALERGSMTFEDRQRATPFRTELGPVTLTLREFSTLPDRDGRLAFEATLESQARIGWEGIVAVNPLRSAGRLTVDNGRLGVLWRYRQDQLQFRLTDGRGDLALNYEVELGPAGLRARVHDGTLAVRDLVLRPLEQDVEALRVPNMTLEGIALEWPERRLSIADLRLGAPHIEVWVDPDGSVNQVRMSTLRGAPPEAEPAAPPAAATAEPGFQVSLGRLLIEDLSAAFEDRTLDPRFRAELRGLRFEAHDLTSEAGKTSPFELGFELASGGSAHAAGQLGLLPAFTIETSTRAERVSLLPLQPYLSQVARLGLDSADLSFDGRLTRNAGESLRWRGKAALENLSAEDRRARERLVGLGRGQVEDMLLDFGTGRVRVASLKLERPYAKLTIFADSTTNVGDVLAVEPAPSGASAAAATADTPSGSSTIEIGEVQIHDGSADFADLSLPLPFAAEIAALEGSISEMSTGGSSARVEAEGRVDEHGLVKVDGSLDFFAPSHRSDVGVAFRNVEMSRLSPYSRKFVGYAVESGRLSLDLRYRIEKRQLASENNIVIEQLTLGEKVESPDAPSLPVRLAVAMLKDRNGRIDLHIPVSGTLDDPEFSYRKLVWQAIRNVLTKVATAPFLALAKLIGAEGKDLEFVEFEPASSEIAPPAREKLEQLARALAERPELLLEVRGVFDEEIDAEALKNRKLDAEVAARVETLPPAAGDEPRLASESRRAALEALFTDRFAAEELSALVARHTAAPPAAEAAPGAAPPAPLLDLSAYLDALRARLVATETVGEAELVQLADARAGSISAFLTGTSAVPAERLQLLPSDRLKRGGDNWIRVKLALTS